MNPAASFGSVFASLTTNVITNAAAWLASVRPSIFTSRDFARQRIARAFNFQIPAHPRGLGRGGNPPPSAPAAFFHGGPVCRSFISATLLHSVAGAIGSGVNLSCVTKFMSGTTK